MEKQRCAVRDAEVAREVEAFGIKDAKGREIGGRWIVIRREYYVPEVGEQVYCGYVAEPCVQWIGRPQALRDGKDYGAWQYGKVFADEAAARAAAAPYFAAARKRAVKIAAK